MALGLLLCQVCHQHTQGHQSELRLDELVGVVDEGEDFASQTINAVGVDTIHVPLHHFQNCDLGVVGFDSDLGIIVEALNNILVVHHGIISFLVFGIFLSLCCIYYSTLLGVCQGFFTFFQKNI